MIATLSSGAARHPGEKDMRKNWLASMPRTASNLLARILNLDAQPTLIRGGVKREYFFMASMGERYGSSSPNVYVDGWTPEKKNVVRAAVQRDFDGLEAHVRAAAAAGRDVFVKEHIPFVLDPVAELRFRWGVGKTTAEEEPWTVDVSNYDGYRSGVKSSDNVTVLPDSVLRTWRPTFLIRHPARAFPSLYRTSLDNEGVEVTRSDSHLDIEMTLTWPRTLYDWYTSSTEVSPLVLDADDVISDPAMVRRYATAIGLDPNVLVFEWGGRRARASWRACTPCGGGCCRPCRHRPA